MNYPVPLRLNRDAFTLVELALVIVLIGLLVGGVLAGQMLIENAATRATISQLEMYNAGVTTFRTRTHGLPGDLTPVRAVNLGLTPRVGSTGCGDGNALLQNGTIFLAQQGLGHETAIFWRDLWDSDLIPTPLANATDAPAASIATSAVPLWLPPAKIRATAFFHVYANSGRHFLYVGGLGANPTDANGTLSLADGLTPNDAFHLDEKLDDGMGHTGTIRAISELAAHTIDSGTGANGDCLNSTNQYNNDGSDGSRIACRITVRTSF